MLWYKETLCANIKINNLYDLRAKKKKTLLARSSAVLYAVALLIFTYYFYGEFCIDGFLNPKERMVFLVCACLAYAFLHINPVRSLVNKITVINY